jgi:hypothetical protein
MRQVRLLALVAVTTLVLGDGPRALAQGASSFVARVDRTSTELGDPIVYEVTLTMPDGRAEAYKAPDFRGFRVLGEYPSQSTQIQMGGGSSVMRTVYTWRYELSPSESGRQTINPARVRVRGKELRTAPVVITVVAGDIRPPGASGSGSATDPKRTRQRPRPRARVGSPFDDLFGGAADPADPLPPIQIPQQGARQADSFLQVVADKRKLVTGEQVVVDWYLYVQENPAGFEVLTEPGMDGFWSEDLLANQTRFNSTQRTYQGRIYLAFLVKRRALFPLQTGKLTISPMEVEIGQGDFFGRIVRKQRLKAEPLTIEVDPLPAAGKPANFDPAAVGKLALVAKLDRQQVAVGDAVTVTVTVSGQGNLRKLIPPKLPPLDGFRSYEPKVDVKLEAGDTGVSGSKVIEYLLLPERAGTTIIPAIELGYFDPAARRYEQARTDPLRIVVTGEAGKGTEPGRPAVAAGAGVENVLAGEIRPPRSRAELSRDLGTTLYRSPGFFWAVLLPPLAFAVTGAVGRFRRRLGQDTEGSRRREARKKVRRHLRAAEGQLGGDARAFYMEIDRVLSGALGARLGQPVAGLSRVELGEALVRGGLPGAVADQALAALEACDRARFAPGSAGEGERRAALDRAEELLTAIEKAPLGGAAGR